MKYLSLLATYTWKHWIVTYALVIFLAIFPLLSVVLGSLLGKMFGCDQMSDVLIPGCPNQKGIEILFIVGWFGLITFPFGGFVLILLIIANFLWHFSRKSGQSQSS